MDTNLESLMHIFSNQVCPFAISFLDEILLFCLSHLGIELPGLQWLSPLLMTFTVLLWVMRGLRFLVTSKSFPLQEI
jgi:hypothetical protein